MNRAWPMAVQFITSKLILDVFGLKLLRTLLRFS